ncbi:peptide MFS transporter [Caedibacter taeniospiralis]|uniref:peptide MFS transporter n=1 Tax=Caedibacter taeniospiralis TaxID=28907 RepID=UPI000C26F190|nr:peptide MFS transporter [Caedibacter taeniospiralis]
MKSALQIAQPKGLYYLFFTELWERFSYFGMRVLLVLYMTQELLFSDTLSYLTYGTFTAFVYITPVLGGYIADTYLGHERSVLLGGILIVCGHLSLAMPDSFFWSGHHICFYLGLSLIIVGTGFFKPTVPTMLGGLYYKNDPRRDSGFIIFYMGISIGSFSATILVTVIAQWLGWHYGFGLAAVGMSIGLIVFLYATYNGIFILPSSSQSIKDLLNKAIIPYVYIIKLIFSIILLLPLFIYLLSHPKHSGVILSFFGLLVLCYFVYLSINLAPQERKTIIYIFLLMFITMLFFSFFEQMGSSVILFTDRHVDRWVFSYQIPAGAYKSLNPLFIMTISPLLVKFLAFLKHKNCNPTTTMKFGIALLMLSIGFGMLALGSYLTTNQGTSMIWLVFAYLFFTIGELLLMPTALSTITCISPARQLGLMIGVFMLAIAFASYISGVLAIFTGIETNFIEEMSISTYFNFFKHICLISAILAIVVMLISPFINKLEQ